MRIGMAHAAHDRVQTVLAVLAAGAGLVADLHDDVPHLGGVLLVGRLVCCGVYEVHMIEMPAQLLASNGMVISR